VLALLCVVPVVPLAAATREAAGSGAPPSPLARSSRTGRLPVQASVLSPGMCGPDRYQSHETQLALAVDGLEECPCF